jgi:hypothetical protein
MISSNLVVTASADVNDESELSINYLNASSHYDYGWNAGRLLRLQYKLIDIFATRFTKINIMEQDIKDQIDYMEQHYPSFLEELKGLSASLNIKLERLLIIQRAISSFFNENSCTTTLSTGFATKNDETFLTLNLDRLFTGVGLILTLIMRLFTYKIRIAKINTMNYRYAFIGVPILWEWPIMNEKGLGFGAVATTLTKNESRYIDEGPGMPTYMLERLTLMTCKNVSEVANLWKNSERASGTYEKYPHHWDNSVPCWCDREGGILVIEQTHNHIITVFGNSTEITGAPEGILWHGNHHQWLDPNITGSKFPDNYPTSALRTERARELLEINYGNITLNVCKEICRDHDGGFNPNKEDSGDICRRPDENDKHITAFSWIIVPKSLTIYLTHGSPCRRRFIKHDFSRIFGK